MRRKLLDALGGHDGGLGWPSAHGTEHRSINYGAVGDPAAAVDDHTAQTATRSDDGSRKNDGLFDFGPAADFDASK